MIVTKYLLLQQNQQALAEQRGAIIEVNASPGLLAHIKPAEGEGRPVGKAIIEHLFHTDKDGRIPLVGITGTQNTGRIARLVSWLVHISGKHVGLACSEGLYLDGRQIVATDCTHWRYAAESAGSARWPNRSAAARQAAWATLSSIPPM